MKIQPISPAKSKCRLDDINLEILNELSENGRISMTDLSKMLHIARPAVCRRITQMEEYGIIKGFTVEIDWDRIELDPARGDEQKWHIRRKSSEKATN